MSDGHSGGAAARGTPCRPIIIHYHFFKNAGTSVDAILRQNFGAAWTSREYPPRSTPSAAREFFVANPHITALSSHTLPLPPPEIPDAEILPVLFIRHPLDRLKSAYLFEREQQADTGGSRLARQHDFAGYLRARLSVPGDRSCRNFQTYRLAMAEPAENGSEAERALRALDRLPFIGSVEAFEESLTALEAMAKPWFPEFRVFHARENVSRAPSSIDDRLAQLEAELGAEMFAIVTAANADDLELYRRALARYPGSRKDGSRSPKSTAKGPTAKQAASNGGSQSAWDEERVAALQLRPARGPSLARVLRERNLSFHSGLSLACGSGNAERDFLNAGICERFHGIDPSPEAIAKARRDVQGLDLTYEATDLNSVVLELGAYDLVVAQNCLHHVRDLEHLAEQVWHSLKPEGYLWVHGYIGESRFQFADERLDIANRILAILPERYRRDRVRDRILRRLSRPNPEALASPVEAVRSADILPVFGRWFEIDYRHEESAFMGRLCPRGMRANYTETEDGPVIFELLMLIEGLLVEHGVLSPHTGQYLMRRKREPLAEVVTQAGETWHGTADAIR